MHGIMLALHRLWLECTGRQRWRQAPEFAQGVGRMGSVLLTFHCVCLGWCFFRLTDLDQAVACARQWFYFASDRLWVGGVADSSLWSLLGLYGATWLVAITFRRRLLQDVCEQVRLHPPLHGVAWGTAVGLLVLAFALSPAGQPPPFIYFRF